MSGNASIETQLVLAKLSELHAKVGELHALVAAQNALINEIKINQGLNATAIGDTLKKTVKDEFAAGVTAAKEKKKTPTTTGEVKAGEEKKAGPAKKSHPTLPEVTEAAWNQKKSGDEYEKRSDWFVSVLSKYPSHLHAIIGTDEVKRINDSTEYKTLVSQCKKQNDREKAKAFLAALRTIKSNEKTWDDLSKKLVADYENQLVILNSQKIGQLTSEVQGVTEAAAASAMAALSLGAPVVIHSTTTTSTATSDATTSTTPAAQLAQLTSNSS